MSISDELERIVTQVVPSTEALDEASFNPVDFVNRAFPNGTRCTALTHICSAQHAEHIAQRCGERRREGE